MDEEKFELELKSSKGIAIVVLVLSIILFLVVIVRGLLTFGVLISFIIRVLLLIGTIVGISKQALYGPICGIIVSILYIISLNLIGIILGVCYLIVNIHIARYMYNN